MLKNKKDKKNSEVKKGLKVIWSYILVYKKEVLKITFLSFLVAFFAVSLPYLTGKIIDSLTNIENIVFCGFEIKNYLFFTIIFSLLVFGNIILFYKKKVISKILWNKVHVDYRVECFNKIISLPFSFHKEKKYGQWSSVLNRASYNLPWIISNRFAEILPDIIFFLFAFIVSLLINVYLGFMILFGVVCCVFVVFYFSKKIEDLSKLDNEVTKKADSKEFEVFFNIFEIKKSSSENFERVRVVNYFKKQLKNVMDRLDMVWNISMFFREGVEAITKISVLLVSVWLFLKGVISIGEIVVILSYVVMVFAPIQKIADVWSWFVEIAVVINDAEKVLKTRPEVYEPKNFKEFSKNFKGEIEFKNVSFAYGEKEKKVLRGIDLKINCGEKVAFVGESGVGKSTAIDLIGAFYFPQKGKLLIDGIETERVKLKDLRKKIAFVSQEISLFNDTVLNNIKYGSEKVTEEEIVEASKKAFADDFIKEFPKKYKTKVGNRGVKLSGGQKQRISIARAILRDPKILILDEPTSSLDIKSEKYITESLSKLMSGRTTIIIAHRLSTVRNADKIFVFKKGEVVETGSHNELLKIEGGEYKKMYDMHIGLS
ncbi:MAG: ABC transporter ATP-binding protein [Candidatus Pacebacteria bacterium]|nr:ABC transporter ATP-binding protein [Candidatus Paceibacterota bacterium]